MPSTEIKPGIKTSEFYAMLAGVIVSILLQANIIGESEAQTWQTLIAELLPAIGGIVMYIWSRTKVKVA